MKPSIFKVGKVHFANLADQGLSKNYDRCRMGGIVHYVKYTQTVIFIHNKHLTLKSLGAGFI